MDGTWGAWEQSKDNHILTDLLLKFQGDKVHLILILLMIYCKTPEHKRLKSIKFVMQQSFLQK